MVKKVWDIMGLKSGKSSENLKTFQDITIKNWNGSTCNCRLELTWINFHIYSFNVHAYANFVFNEIVNIKIY